MAFWSISVRVLCLAGFCSYLVALVFFGIFFSGLKEFLPQIPRLLDPVLNPLREDMLRVQDVLRNVEGVKLKAEIGRYGLREAEDLSDGPAVSVFRAGVFNGSFIFLYDPIDSSVSAFRPVTTINIFPFLAAPRLRPNSSFTPTSSRSMSHWVDAIHRQWHEWVYSRLRFASFYFRGYTKKWMDFFVYRRNLFDPVKKNGSEMVLLGFENDVPKTTMVPASRDLLLPWLRGTWRLYLPQPTFLRGLFKGYDVQDGKIFVKSEGPLFLEFASGILPVSFGFSLEVDLEVSHQDYWGQLGGRRLPYGRLDVSLVQLPDSLHRYYREVLGVLICLVLGLANHLLALVITIFVRPLCWMLRRRRSNRESEIPSLSDTPPV